MHLEVRDQLLVLLITSFDHLKRYAYTFSQFVPFQIILPVAVGIQIIRVVFLSPYTLVYIPPSFTLDGVGIDH